MERVTRRRVRRLATALEDWALRQEVERLSAEHGVNPAEVLIAARRAMAWCRHYRLVHGVHWVDGKVDVEPELRGYAAAQGLDAEELLARTERLAKGKPVA